VNGDTGFCSHENANICATCDHNRYYASTYPGVPWAESVPAAE
jgi:hypothetical protein